MITPSKQRTNRNWETQAKTNRNWETLEEAFNWCYEWIHSELQRSFDRLGQYWGQRIPGQKVKCKKVICKKWNWKRSQMAKIKSKCQKSKCRKVMQEVKLPLAHAPLGGGANIAPLPDFFDSSKTAADIDAKLSVPSPASIWRRPLKFQKNLLRKWHFSDVMFRHFGSKTANVWMLLEGSVLM